MPIDDIISLLQELRDEFDNLPLFFATSPFVEDEFVITSAYYDPTKCCFWIDLE